MSDDDVTALRVRLHRAGYVPIPCVGKIPAIKEWQKHTETNETEIELWSRVFWDATNTGVLTAKNPCLDIDILDPEAAEAVEALVFARYGDTGCVMTRTGQAPKRLIPFRLSGAAFVKITNSLIAPDGKIGQKLEFLAAGQQAIFHGVHPDTGKPYTWVRGDPTQIALRDLPAINAAEAQLLVLDCAELLMCEHAYRRATAHSEQPRQQETGADCASGPSKWDALVAEVISGTSYHEPLDRLAAMYVASGMNDGAIVNCLRALMNASTAPHDAQRWQPRFNDIPRDVSTARAKFSQPQQPSPGTVPLPFINMSSWDTTPVPDRKWSVRNRIPARQPSLFSGEGAVGKTLVELQLCAAHVLSRDWLGSLPEPGPAIYVGCEDEPDELHRRLAEIATHYQATFADMIRGGLHLISLAGEDALLGAPDRTGKIVPTPLYNQLLQAAGDIKPKHIGLDTSADVFGGNELDRAQVRQFVGMLRKLAIVSDGAVVLLSHPSLQGIASGSGLSGSTGWHNSVRARMYLRCPKTAEGEQPKSDLRELEFKKNNYGPVSESVVLRFDKGLFKPEAHLSSLDKTAREQKIDSTFLDVLSNLINQNRPLSPAANASNYAPTIIATHPNGNAYLRKDYQDAMERLLNAGKIHAQTAGPPSRPRTFLMTGAADRNLSL